MFILALGVIFCVMLLLAGAALFSPVIVTVDTAAHHVRIRWLLMLEYMVALPGGTGESRLSVAGNPVRIRPQKRTKSSGAKAPDSRNQKKSGGRSTSGKFLIRCLRDSTIRRVLPRQVAKLLSGMLRSITLTRSRANVCLPDPATTGILAGTLARSRWGRRLGVRMNFTDVNSVFCEIRLYPHRVVKAILFFLGGLPYVALYRNWRAST
jgi:hypothetical protein